MTTSITEENRIAQATADGPTPKRSKKARVAQRRAPVGSAKAKSSQGHPGKESRQGEKPAGELCAQALVEQLSGVYVFWFF